MPPSQPNKPGRVPRSQELFRRALELIPGGTQLVSRRPTRFANGVSPTYAVRARGARFWDVDGHEYIDWVSGIGAILLGYADPVVDEAVKRQIDSGTMYSVNHELEIELAEELVRSIPCAEMVRYAKCGGEACAMAVRIARGATGRDKVLFCYDPETEVLTQQGFKRFPELQGDEVLATLNPVTEELEWQAIQRLVVQDFDGHLIHFRSEKRLDLLVTPDHRIYREYEDHRGRKMFRLEAAQDTVRRKRASPIYMTAAAKWQGCHPAEISIPQMPHNRWKTKGITRFPAAPFMRFLGYYVTEGCVVRQARGRYEIQIAQNPGPVQDKILETIRSMGFRPHVSGGNHVRFSSKELCAYLEPFGGVTAKHLSPWMKNLSVPLLTELFEAMIDGDGMREKGQARRFYTSSRALADDMCEIALKLGYSTTTTSHRGVGFSKQSCVYHVSLSRRTVRQCLPHQISHVPYKGPVYCVTVPNHIIFVRRNGKTVWSGNCGYHGWHDWYLAANLAAEANLNAHLFPGIEAIGVPKALAGTALPFPYGDLNALGQLLDEHRGQVAAIIMEPLRSEHPPPGYLAGVAKLSQQYGTILIFDEVSTGFRFGTAGAQGYVGVTPDMAVFAKSMSNGYPMSAVVGKRAVMEPSSRMFISSTYWSDTIGLRATLTTIQEVRKRDLHACLTRLGTELQRRLTDAAREAGLAVRCGGLAVHPALQFETTNPTIKAQLSTLFIQEMAKRGCHGYTSFYLNGAQGAAEVEQTVAAAREAFALMQEGLRTGNISALLECDLQQDAFRRLVR